ncbi:sugar transporter [Gregarina niphandrodes]|uniref:Hexose transporter 1 n=1 Tax=Gregarina niphandrodes TaxID=110365 RepID=A0A023B8C3_GRENI|nr:sugar transporter [Gregarina niphandrodes]EZG68923.1 sugar transporter [Gregarina niphandrodes]|eukprot:XP_011134514.1 sugar transporter [Gregarina niphandrodes]
MSSSHLIVHEEPTRNYEALEDPEGECAVDWSSPFKTCWCGCFSFMMQLILVAACGSFLFGFNISLLNTAIGHIAWELEWCDWRGGTEDVTDCTAYKNYNAFISTAVFIGAAIGSMTGGVFMAFGRRGMILLSMAVFVFGIVSSCCANSFSALLWARLVCGYAVGLVSVCCPCYMSEITPPAVRGKYGVFHQLFVTVGILVGTLIGLPIALKCPIPNLSDQPAVNINGKVVRPIPDIEVFAKVWWRVMLGIGIIPVIFTSYLLGFVYTFETPYYYVEKGQIRDAQELLKKITKKSDVTEELTEIRQNVDEAMKAQEAGMTLGQAWKSRSDYRWVIFIGCLLAAFQQLGGINVFIASSNKLFQDAGLSGKWPTIMSNIMNLVNCVMTLPAVPLIERLGRRTLMIIGTVGMTIAVGPAAICYLALEDGSKVTQWLAIIGCIVFIIFFAATYGPILWVYLFEIYPIEIKGSAAGAATAVNWIAGIIMVFVTAYLDNKESYMIFFIMCGVSAVIVFLWMKETKGRQLGDSPFVNN